MLIYHPAFDVNHCLYRLLSILQNLLPNDSIEIERLQIIDFFIVFPKALLLTRIPQDYSKIKKPLKNLSSDYRNCHNPYLVFQKMAPLQLNAIEHLISVGILLKSNKDLNILTKANVTLPSSLIFNNQLYSDRLEYSLEQNILKYLMSYELLGPNGLKARTHLMEYRYDILST